MEHPLAIKKGESRIIGYVACSITLAVVLKSVLGISTSLSSNVTCLTIFIFPPSATSISTGEVSKSSKPRSLQSLSLTILSCAPVSSKHGISDLSIFAGSTIRGLTAVGSRMNAFLLLLYPSVSLLFEFLFFRVKHSSLVCPYHKRYGHHFDTEVFKVRREYSDLSEVIDFKSKSSIRLIFEITVSAVVKSSLLVSIAVFGARPEKKDSSILKRYLGCVQS